MNVKARPGGLERNREISVPIPTPGDESDLSRKHVPTPMTTSSGIYGILGLALSALLLPYIHTQRKDPLSLSRFEALLPPALCTLYPLASIGIVLETRHVRVPSISYRHSPDSVYFQRIFFFIEPLPKTQKMFSSVARFCRASGLLLLHSSAHRRVARRLFTHRHGAPFLA